MIVHPLRRWFFDDSETPASTLTKVLTFVVLLIALGGICFGVLAASIRDPQAVWNYRTVFWRGWVLTIGISAAALVLSCALGLLVALARRSSFLLLRHAATLFVEIIRGSPLLVLILFGFYVVFQQASDTLRLPIGILILSVFSAAYIAEMIRAGIESVGASQLESARAIGLSPLQTYRFVIFPQAIRQILPPLAGQFASLIKDSSLLSIIGLAEFTFAAQQVNSATFSTLEAYLPLLPGYLILTLPISLFARALESRLRYET